MAVRADNYKNNRVIRANTLMSALLLVRRIFERFIPALNEIKPQKFMQKAATSGPSGSVNQFITTGA